MCKHEGFTYAPSETVYWEQGRSTERDFIYVTTQTLSQGQLAQLSEEVGEGRTLLICCGAFRGKADAFPNLTVKKVPHAVLNRCEWGRDDYSLNVASLRMAEDSPRANGAGPAVNGGGPAGDGRGPRRRAEAREEEPSLPLFELPPDW
jgi:adenine-specific DNA-methyltransferase